MSIPLALAVVSGHALAFDSGPHHYITGDAMRAEGFSEDAIQVAQLANWLTDIYNFPQIAAFGRFDASAKRSAAVLHFDYGTTLVIDGSVAHLTSTKAIEMEWDRLMRATREAALEAARRGDTIGLLTVIGISTHEVEDFYAHTNWVEPKGNRSVNGFDGPGFGGSASAPSNPTFFDLSSSERAALHIYTGVPGATVPHGSWSCDPRACLNKDWPGRPYYARAYESAYFATRQWLQAIAAWLPDAVAWHAAQGYLAVGSARSELDFEAQNEHGISFDAGHWMGEGEPFLGSPPGPGGSLDDLLAAAANYITHTMTRYRAKFQQEVPMVASADPPQARTPVPCSAPIETGTGFLTTRITHVRDATPSHSIDPGTDQADFYVRERVDGAEYRSGMIHGHDDFAFPQPTYPFTLIRPYATVRQPRPEPVASLYVTIGTSDSRLAGTDDNVYVQFGDHLRFQLDKPGYDDFERGATDTYSLRPPPGTTMQDLRYVQIDKSPDGAAGGWQLRSVAVQANGRQLYNQTGIDTWLQDDHRTWRAPGYVVPTATTTRIPVILQLWDSDGFAYLGDDHTDINPNYSRYDLNLLVDPADLSYYGDMSGTTSGTSTGGSAYGGGGKDGDTAAISFVFTSTTNVPPRCGTSTPQAIGR